MCLDCGFYKGRMVVDMSAKKKAREERMEAKKEMINEQKGNVDTDATESIPEGKAEVPLEKIATKKSKVVESPEMAQERMLHHERDRHLNPHKFRLERNLCFFLAC